MARTSWGLSAIGPYGFHSLVFRLGAILLLVVLGSIGLVSTLSYREISRSSAENASIRIERAARAAAEILNYGTGGILEPELDAGGHPTALRMSAGHAADGLNAAALHDRLVLAIAQTNQGAANLFRWSDETAAFDRIATTFRKPDGSLPPPFTIREGHPAYASLAAGRPFTGNVPVQGRMRLASLTPILAPDGRILGIAAIDVGWADDLTLAEQRLKSRVLSAAAIILAGVSLLGGILLRYQLAPLRRIAGAAHRLANGQPQRAFPCAERKDEIGDLTHGLARVTELQDKLHKLAYVDPVTAAGNRTRYFEDLETALGSARSGGPALVLYQVDFTSFARVNDTFGPSVGNHVLQQTYTRLRTVFGQDARISRVSADDFCILLPFDGDRSHAEAQAVSAIDALSAPFELEEGEIRAEPCIGIAVLPQDARDAETAHRISGLAVRAAKENLHQRHMFFSEPLNERIQTEMLLEARLRSALTSGHMQLRYQPQICPSSGDVVGLEALARWPNAPQDTVPPSAFIPLAEKTGLILDLGREVLEAACGQAAVWHREGLAFGHISVNVSPIEFRQANFAETINTILQRQGLPAGMLCLEVTESVFVDTSETMVLDILNALQSIGVHLSLDDFGAGYSSLSYLYQLPFQELKIDRTFLLDADKDRQKRQIYEAVVGLGKSLGLRVVAEGAETEAEFALARHLGCDSVQGYYCSPALPAADVPQRTAAIKQMLASTGARSGAVLGVLP